MPGIGCHDTGDAGTDHSEFGIFKKLDEPSESIQELETESEPITLNKLTIAGVDRGLTVDAIKEMELGHVVDFVIEYNDMHDPERVKKEQKKQNIRKATQADWDAFWG